MFQKKYFFLAVLFLIGCKAKIAELPKEIDVSEQPDVVFYNFKMYYKINSKLKAEAIAPVLNKYERNQNLIEFPSGVKVYFYDENLKLRASLTADKAYKYEARDFWKLEGNVIIKNLNGAYLKTQELFFYEKTQTLYSKKYVEVINNDGTVIRGKGGFESNIDFSEYEFKNVDGIISSFNTD